MGQGGQSPFRLPDDRLPKARRYVRALRRATLDYWYATIEDVEAAYLEASVAAFVVNILDEAVFEDAHGETYREQRAQSRLGQVVTGLELIRNCETHAQVVFDRLLVEQRQIGVPLNFGSQVMRLVLTWAPYDDLPPDYRELPQGSTQNQIRARREAQHGYRQAIQGRSVIETLFDAMAFFQGLDERLVVDQPRHSRWAFAELPDTDPNISAPTECYIAKPLGLDQYEVLLPDLACRWWDRRSPSWEATDEYLRDRVKSVEKEPPASESRQVLCRILDAGGSVVGYGGVAHGADQYVYPTWVERHQRVWRDVKGGYRYFIEADGLQLDLESPGHNLLQALDAQGNDLLAKLPPASEWMYSLDRLMMAEEYRDQYLVMRLGYS